MARPARGDRRQRFREEPPGAVAPGRERLVYVHLPRLLGASLTLNLALLIVVLFLAL